MTSYPEVAFDLGPPSVSGLQRGPPSNRTLERRCLRKHRRRADDDECLAKRRKLAEDGADLFQSSSPRDDGGFPQTASTSASTSASSPGRPEAEGSCMEVDAAQRRLREIEDGITLEDDEDDEDLDVESFPRRPVLVMSESLRQGLQRGMNDILPHKVAQSMNHSCMELVLWRPPEDALSRRLKDSLQRQQRKQQTAGRGPPSPGPSPSHQGAPEAPRPPPYSPEAYGEEDMEL
ncbi:hypothetical protein NHX12_028450 [Muraenolepis orangiensis]|uniref:Coiled-coil domain-containing protein 117 n=1 Tax=Muraenolepis orangiensis TaxID=630683 RepID=A0A9Q0EA85_9TELE|nr:hypothetical protein NHX12_028450 [Muraenolepis orangiensis]